MFTCFFVYIDTTNRTFWRGTSVILCVERVPVLACFALVAGVGEKTLNKKRQEGGREGGRYQEIANTPQSCVTLQCASTHPPARMTCHTHGTRSSLVSLVRDGSHDTFCSCFRFSPLCDDFIISPLYIYSPVCKSVRALRRGTKRPWTHQGSC